MNEFYKKLRTTRAAMFLLLGLFMMAGAAAFAQTTSPEVTVVTDQDDYWPGEWVYITGTGF